MNTATPPIADTPSTAPAAWLESPGTADLVSVIIPTRNRARLLTDTVACFFAQTYRPIEILIVDDESEDNTAETVSQLQRDCPEGISITYIPQQQAGGPAARNRGAEASSGEFLVFMDDDDLADDQFLSSRMEVFRERPAVNLAFGPWQQFVLQDDLYHLPPPKQVPDFDGADSTAVWRQFLGKWELLLQGCVIRRSLVADVGPWALDLRKSQDLDYKARLLSANCHPAPSQTGIVYYRLHDSSVSGSFDAGKSASYVEVLETIEAITANRADYEQLRHPLATSLWNHAFWLYGKGSRQQARAILDRAIKHWPEIVQRSSAWTTLSRLRLVGLVGPIYCCISRIKKAAGLSKRQFERSTPKLPLSPSQQETAR